MQHLKSWLVALAAQGLAFGAAAQGAYVAGSGGRANWAYDCGPNGCQRGTTAWRGAVGYRFNSVVALEGLCFDFGRARSSSLSWTERSAPPEQACNR
jgi:hypothetical protein